MRIRRSDPLFASITLDWAHGRCAWFALAASHAYGLPLVAHFNDAGRMVHVACITALGVFDAYGIGSPSETLRDFQALGFEGGMLMRACTDAQVRKAFELNGPEHDAELADALHVVHAVMAALGITDLQLGEGSAHEGAAHAL